MKIATWNINSVRLRLNQVLRFIQGTKIDVICLQETKTQDQFFPLEDLQKNWNEISNIIEVKSLIMA